MAPYRNRAATDKCAFVKGAPKQPDIDTISSKLPITLEKDINSFLRPT